MASQLRDFLEDKAGEKSFEFVIPHPFLPPRFQKLCQNRNMILLLDTDFTIHVRWEGIQSDVHFPLTPGKTRLLLKDVFRKMKKYRSDLVIYGRFLDQCAEEPFDDERYDGSGTEEESEVVAVLSGEEILEGKLEDFLGGVELNLGGESPLPDIDYGEGN